MHPADSIKLHKAKKQQKKKIVHDDTVYPRRTVKGYKPYFDNCHFTNQYTATQRLKMYPFAVAAKILAVSYFGGGEPNPDIVIDGKPPRVRSAREDNFYNGLVINNHRIDYSTLFGVKILNPAQINNLTNILFNYEYTGMKNYTIIGHAACFDPRNSIIFLDKNDNVIDHLDICFSCHRSESPTYKITEGTECKQKYDMLSDFFVGVGIPYGTADRSKWKSPLDSIKR
jgi:hypothetical protein